MYSVPYLYKCINNIAYNIPHSRSHMEILSVFISVEYDEGNLVSRLLYKTVDVKVFIGKVFFFKTRMTNIIIKHYRLHRTRQRRIFEKVNRHNIFLSLVLCLTLSF